MSHMANLIADLCGACEKDPETCGRNMNDCLTDYEAKLIDAAYEEKVTRKSVSLVDCAGCADLTKCGAHITGGPVKQCAPIIDADQMNLDLRGGKVLQTFRSGNMVIKEVVL